MIFSVLKIPRKRKLFSLIFSDFISQLLISFLRMNFGILENESLCRFYCRGERCKKITNIGTKCEIHRASSIRKTPKEESLGTSFTNYCVAKALFDRFEDKPQPTTIAPSINNNIIINNYPSCTKCTRPLSKDCLDRGMTQHYLC